MTSCLLIIDVQQGFINDSTKHIPILVAKEQEKYQHIFISRFFNPPKSFFRNNLNWHKMDKNSSEWKLAFSPVERAIIIDKDKYSIVNSEFLKKIEEKKIKEIHIVGIDTDACVLYSTIALFDCGYKVKVLSRLCASSAGTEYHDMGIKLLIRSIGKNQVILD